MLSSTRRRLAGPLLAAVVTVLVLASAAGATHQMGFGHTNTLMVGETTNVYCNLDDNCSYFGNDSSGNLARGVTGSHDSASGTAAGVLGETISTSNLAEGLRGWVLSPNPGAGSAGVRGVNGGTAANGIGVWGSQAGGGIGTYGSTPSGLGVLGTTDTGIAGVLGLSSSGAGAGVIGSNVNGFAGYFSGNVHVAGTLTKAGGAFRIDHPLDPERKWLQHAFVESPDMLNVYNGNARTGGRGFAVVKLPGYFQALNRDFRYQLTVVGTRGWRARVAKEIEGNRFTIQSDVPFTRVSWQVTGVRKDSYANSHRIPVELAKSPVDATLRAQVRRSTEHARSIVALRQQEQPASLVRKP
jgi:hypothetical protein